MGALNTSVQQIVKRSVIDIKNSANPGRFARRIKFILAEDDKNNMKEKLEKVNQKVNKKLILVNHFVLTGATTEEKRSIEDKKHLCSYEAEQEILLTEDKKHVSLYALEVEFKLLCELHGEIETCAWIKSAEEIKKIEELRASLSEEDILIIEEYKLSIMRAVQLHYQKLGAPVIKELPVNDMNASLAPASKSSIALFIFLAVTQALLMAIGGFTGMMELIKILVSGISNIALYFISGILTVIECIMSYSIHAPYLKKGLGIPEPEMDRIITTVYDEQLQAILNINHALRWSAHLPIKWMILNMQII